MQRLWMFFVIILLLAPIAAQSTDFVDYSLSFFSDFENPLYRYIPFPTLLGNYSGTDFIQNLNFNGLYLTQQEDVTGTVPSDYLLQTLDSDLQFSVTRFHRRNEDVAVVDDIQMQWGGYFNSYGDNNQTIPDEHFLGEIDTNSYGLSWSHSTSRRRNTGQWGWSSILSVDYTPGRDAFIEYSAPSIGTIYDSALVDPVLGNPYVSSELAISADISVSWLWDIRTGSFTLGLLGGWYHDYTPQTYVAVDRTGGINYDEIMTVEDFELLSVFEGGPGANLQTVQTSSEGIYSGVSFLLAYDVGYYGSLAFSIIANLIESAEYKLSPSGLIEYYGDSNYVSNPQQTYDVSSGLSDFSADISYSHVFPQSRTNILVFLGLDGGFDSSSLHGFVNDQYVDAPLTTISHPTAAQIIAANNPDFPRMRGEVIFPLQLQVSTELNSNVVLFSTATLAYSYRELRYDVFSITDNAMWGTSDIEHGFVFDSPLLAGLRLRVANNHFLYVSTEAQLGMDGTVHASPPLSVRPEVVNDPATDYAQREINFVLDVTYRITK